MTTSLGGGRCCDPNIPAAGVGGRCADARRVVEMSHNTLVPDPSPLPLHGRSRPGTVMARAFARNEVRPLEIGWVDEIRINLSAAEQRVATLPGRRTVKNDAQAGWLLKAVSCIDLTTLNGDDTSDRVRRLCAKARAPVRADIWRRSGLPNARCTPPPSASIIVLSRPRSKRLKAQTFPSLRYPQDSRRASSRTISSSRRSKPQSGAVRWRSTSSSPASTS